MDRIGKVDVMWSESSACRGTPWELIPTQLKGAYKIRSKLKMNQKEIVLSGYAALCLCLQ